MLVEQLNEEISQKHAVLETKLAHLAEDVTSIKAKLESKITKEVMKHKSA